MLGLQVLLTYADSGQIDLTLNLQLRICLNKMRYSGFKTGASNHPTISIPLFKSE